MYIERLQVEEGFLAGLDVEFKPGLNVIIGARGTGKTSLIELVRYALDSPAFTSEALQRGRQQAMAVLEGGLVTVTLRDENGRYVVARSADGGITSTAPGSIPCTVLAQNEVEAVGAQASGRLHLVDRFMEVGPELDEQIRNLQAEVKSLTIELRGILQEGLNLADQINELKSVDADLKQAKSDQQAMLSGVQATADERQRLEQLQESSRALSTRATFYADSMRRMSTFADELRKVRTQSTAVLGTWPESAGEVDRLADIREQLDSVSRLLSTAYEQASRTLAQVVALQEADETQRSQVDTASRQLRQRLDELQAGVSQTTRRVAELQEREGEVSALRSLLGERRAQFNEVFDSRSEVYDKLDEARDAKYKERARIAADLSNRLGPTIRIRTTRSHVTSAYVSAVVAGLRGSGLHYNTLAPILTRSMSPYELVTAVEWGNSDEIAKAAEVTGERASAIVSALRSANLGEIMAADIEDSVSLQLLDGQEYKDSQKLSIGQRCTVVLPVLLQQQGGMLLVDQPEDHLDNAFITSTLVPALRQRHEGDQYVFSSHNANLPVLGDADQVVVMDSDGRRGYATHVGHLSAPRTVESISNILEGGREAFERRARFYGDRED